MTAARPDLADLVERLAAADVAGWEGLPAGLAPAGGDLAAALELGDDHVPAAMTRGAGSARVWSRRGEVVLVDVALRPEGDPTALAPLGPFDAERVRYGLVGAEERVYAPRGLAAIVDPGGAVVHHLIAFGPTTAEAYRRSLRPGLATTRRPLESR